jgi:tetratricopeptide (TPR) repeat protein
MESGQTQFQNEAYEEALTSFQQAKNTYDDIGSAKTTKCDPWVKKARTGVEADALVEMAEGEYETGHYESALDLFETAKEKYESIESTEESECDYWIERAQKGADADDLMESGKEQFQNEAYEDALTSFQQAKDTYDDIGSAKTTECDPWIEKTQTGIDADNLMESGQTQFQNEAYEEALTSFQQAKNTYESIGSSKVSECDLWIKKTQDEMEGTCLGTTFLLALIAGLLLSKRNLF